MAKKTGKPQVSPEIRQCCEYICDHLEQKLTLEELAQKLGAGHILRGVRSVQDYAYELQMADVNRGLSGVDTVLLPALPQLACLSSSVVRELAHFGRRWQDMLPEGLQYHINM